MTAPDFSFAVSISVSLVDDAEIRALNRDYRGKDKPTDVLSFPLWEADLGLLAPESSVELGDLIISVETAARQAVELKHTWAEEIAFLAIHGTLHLLGYDHADARGTETNVENAGRNF